MSQTLTELETLREENARLQREVQALWTERRQLVDKLRDEREWKFAYQRRWGDLKAKLLELAQ